MASPQRKIILIKRTLQLKVVLLTLAAMLGTALVAALDFYYVAGKILAQLEGEVVTRIYADLGALLISHLAVLMLVACVVGIFISHRFAGPIFRFEQTFKKVAEGDLTAQVHLRGGDDLMEAASLFNDMLACLREKIKMDRHLAERLQHELDRLRLDWLKTSVSSQALAQKMAEMALELGHLTRGFQIDQAGKD